MPITLKGALPRACAVAAQALVTKLLHAWALLHLRFYLVVGLTKKYLFSARAARGNGRGAPFCSFAGVFGRDS